MAFENINLRRSDGIGYIEFDRVEASNAATPEMMKEVCDALDMLTADAETNAIVLTGRGKHFLAGGDFEFLTGLLDTPTVDVRDTLYKYFQGATRRLYESSKPTIAAVSGAAVTVGCEIALACDVRIATPTAKFQQTWVKIGLTSPLGGAFLLPRLVGLTLAKEMLLEARPVRAEEALKVGLINQVVEAEDLLPAATERAKEMAELPRHAFRALKEAVHRGLQSTMEHEWASNVMAQSILLDSQDFADRMRALDPRKAKR